MKSLLLITVFTFLYSCNLPITSGNGTFEFNGKVSEGGNEAIDNPWGGVNSVHRDFEPEMNIFQGM